MDLLKFAEAHGIEVDHTTAKSYSTDDNLSYLSSEAGMLEQIENETPDHVFKLVPQPYMKNVANKPEYLTIQFKAGIPVKVDLLGEKFGKPVKTITGSLAIMGALNTIGQKHAIGNTDIVETRVNGLKNHGVYQNPGAAIIYAAHDDMQDICLDKEVLKLQYHLSTELSYIVYEGF
jgi:argininosuccinate synthase